ncbi:uncharacterized protein [Pyxicephalus adspersus]|uniref:uncharacterized protein isoform X2 n=1 Tax=Pyxicephalus adspersus TaxID=30357 RepID=UPI003B599ECB
MSAELGLTPIVKIKEEEIPADISVDLTNHRSTTQDKGTSCRYEPEYREDDVQHPVKEENLNIVVVDIGSENARGNEIGMRMEEMDMHSDIRTQYTKSRKGYIRKPYKKWWSPVKNHGVVHKMKYVRRRLPSEYIMNPEFLKEFINMYRSYPCLWNIKFADYSNKQKRMKAYEQLVQLCRTVCPTANIQFVKHKIANLRTVFKNEFNKVQVSKKTASCAADVYVPRLWYFDLLKFTLGQDPPEDGSAGMSDTSSMVSVPCIPSILKRPDTPEPQDSRMDEDGKMNPETLEESTNMSQVTSNSQSDDVEFEIHDEIMASIRRQRKRKMYNNTSEEELGERLLTQAAALLTKNNDEFDAFGFMVSSKLRRMDEQQRLLAEVLIMEVLYKGMLGQLTEDSLVCQYPAQFYQNQPSS